jgi:hypothetical protein
MAMWVMPVVGDAAVPVLQARRNHRLLEKATPGNPRSQTETVISREGIGSCRETPTVKFLAAPDPAVRT